MQDRLTILPYLETPFMFTALPLKGAAYYEGELGISYIISYLRQIMIYDIALSLSSALLAFFVFR